MRGELLDRSERSGTPGRFMLQNERMLKVDLTGTGRYFYARQGSMVISSPSPKLRMCT